MGCRVCGLRFGVPGFGDRVCGCGVQMQNVAVCLEFMC